MYCVGLKTLKNKLSEYVRLVAAGETVLVTDRDVVVAELIPPRHGRLEHADDAHLADLVRRGIVEPPRASRGVPPREPAAPTQEILDGLDEDREDR